MHLFRCALALIALLVALSLLLGCTPQPTQDPTQDPSDEQLQEDTAAPDASTDQDDEVAVPSSDLPSLPTDPEFENAYDDQSTKRY